MPTGQTEPTETQKSLSADGSNAGRGGAAVSPRDTVVEWLIRRNPAEVDRAAVSQALQRNVQLNAVTEFRPRYSGGAFLGSDAAFTGYSVEGSEEDRQTALADLRRLMTPAGVSQIEAWLAELSVITAKRPGDDFEEALRLSAYTSRLSDFPADVVRYALLERPWRFFPTWEELSVACREAVSRRKAMIEALERGPGTAMASKTQERRKPISPEKASAIVAEIYGKGLG